MTEREREGERESKSVCEREKERKNERERRWGDLEMKKPIHLTLICFSNLTLLLLS